MGVVVLAPGQRAEHCRDSGGEAAPAAALPLRPAHRHARGLHRLGEVPRPEVALARRLGHPEARQWRDLLGQLGAGQGSVQVLVAHGGGSAQVGGRPGQALDEDHRRRVEIGLDARLLAAPQLGRHVLRRPLHPASARGAGEHPQLRHAGDPLAVDQDLLRAQIAVEYPLAVRRLQSQQGVAQHHQRGLHVPKGPGRGHQLAQPGPVHVVGHQGHPEGVLDVGAGADHVGAVEVGDDLCLGPEPPQEEGIAEVLLG